MTQLLVCPQGHRWQSDSGQSCPWCGKAPLAAASVVGKVRAEALSPNPEGPPDPPTVLLDAASVPPEKGERTPDRTLAPVMPTGALAVGKTVNTQYEILGELGRGGMGVVYKAKQVRLNRFVALKMILAGSHAGPEQLARFQAEAEALAPLQHTNIVQIYEVGALDGHPYFSLEYVEGGSLSQKLAGAPQPPRLAAQMIETLARAMHFAHQKGVVHRDLKPANVLLQEAQGSQSLGVPKITDFGLAKRLEDDSGQTKSGAVLGTPSYIAPEQAAGQKNIGPSVDTYALGAILYEMLTGRPPFRGESSMDTMLQVMTVEPVPPTRLQPKVPAELETICLKCLAKEPHKRYATALDLAEDLRRFLAGEPILAKPSGPVERAWKWAKRRPAAAALIAVVGLAFLAGLIMSLGYNAQLAIANSSERQRAKELAEQKTKAEDERKLAVEARLIAQAAEKAAKERLELSRRSLYSFQLMQVAALGPRDPKRGLESLNDPERCPPDLRDFTWSYLERLCRRDKGTLAGSKSPVGAVAFMPDGKTVAGLSGEDAVIYWDVTSGKPQDPFRPKHKGTTPVIAIALSPDGQTLATAGFDKTVKLWNAATGADQGTLEGHKEGVRAVAFSADGKTLASGSDDRTIILWDLAGQKPRATLTGHRGPITCLAFPRDGRLLVSGSHDKTVRVWDAAAGTALGPALEGHGESVLAVAVSRGGRLAASAGVDRTIRLWDIIDRKPVDTLRGHIETVHALAFAPDGGTLASGSADRTVKLWHPATGEERTTFRGHADAVLTLAFTNDGKTLASGSADRTVKLWEMPVSVARPFRVDMGAEPGLPAVTALSGDGQVLATVSNRDKVIRLWELLREKENVFRQGFTFSADALALSGDGKLVAVAAADQTIRVFERAKGKERPPLKGHTARINALVFAPDGATLASAGQDGRVKLWDMAAHKEVGEDLHPAAVRCLAFTRDGKHLAAGGDRAVRLWDIPGRNAAPILTSMTSPVRLLAFSTDGQALAAGSDDGVALWDVPRRQTRLTLKPTAAVRAVVFAPDEKTLATGHADWSITLWDPVTGQERATLVGHTTPIHALTFTTSGLVSVSEDGAVRLWPGGRGAK